jgi:alanine dehydrogenase
LRIGVPLETKEGEERVALTPLGAKALVERGHAVTVQAGAGTFCGFTDEDYAASGASLSDGPAEAWSAELVMKVKEPLPSEYGFLRNGLMLFTFLHLAADRGLTEALVSSGVTALGYETVELSDGSLPLLEPMSEIAGCLAVVNGGWLLDAHRGGRGVLLPGISGSPPGRVTVVGGGIAGINACRIAWGMGAHVTVLDASASRLSYLRDVFQGRVSTVISSPGILEELLPDADLVVAAVLVHGSRAPRLITRRMVGMMPRGAVLVDISIDQGGISETSRPTTHADPFYVVDGVVHSCITNLPAAVPRSATLSLAARTLPYAVEIADRGLDAAIAEDPALAMGLNTRGGNIIHPGVLEAFGQGG